MSTLFDRFRAVAKSKQPTVVFPEGEDDRVIAAAKRFVADGFGEAIILGSFEQIVATADAAGVDISETEVIDPQQARTKDKYTEEYKKIRSVSEATARSILGKPLLFGALLVRSGEADAIVGGCVQTTGDLISAALEVISLAEGIDLPSSCFVMEFDDHRPLLYADAAVNPNPTAEELADIAIASAQSAQELLDSEPRVAFLSFSTRGSANHEDVEKVRSAVDLVEKRDSEYTFDGEFQADTALNTSIARRKLDGDIGDVGGQANTLIFPDLDAANISYKLTQELANAKAYGPILQGFRQPVSDLSRGATTEDILGAAIITANLIED